MKQLQWFYARLAALFLATVAGAPPALSQDDPDSTAWQDAKQAGTLSAFQSYLEAYPNGRHSEEAFRAIVEQSLSDDAAGANQLSADLY